MMIPRPFVFFILAAGAFAQAPKPAPKKLPLTPERTIDFTTDEGTWLSLDLSPDGNTIVFELLGDIYTLPAKGGEAKPLLTGMPMETQPRYSPDGSKLAFLSDRDGSENLWMMDVDGANLLKLSRETKAEFASPVWSPDGEYVVVSKGGTGAGANELWMYHRLGGPGLQVTKSKATPTAPRTDWNNDLGAVFSPDGDYLYFARRKSNFTYNATLPLWQIVRRNMVTGDEDTITTAPGSAFAPRITPDGKQLVYATRYEQQTAFRARILATGDERWLAGNVARDDQESRASRDLLPGYAFTPDSKWLVASYGGKINRIPVDKKGESEPVPFKANVHLELGPLLEFPARIDDGPTVRSRLMMAPTVSPDGMRVAFSAFAHLYIANVDGTDVHRLTATAETEFQPAWSPDGKSIVYVTWSANGGNVWTANVPAAGTGTPRKISTVDAFYRDPAFTPDGQHIFVLHAAKFTRFELESEFGAPQGGLDLIDLPTNGAASRTILESRGTGKPHFGPEPDRVYIYSPQGLMSMRFDGSDRRIRLKVVGPNTRGAVEPPAARDVRINAKGDRALAVVDAQLWLVPVPRTGIDAPVIDVSKPGLPVRKLTRVGVDGYDWARDGTRLYVSTGASLKTIQLDDAGLAPKDPGEVAAAPQGREVDFNIEIPRIKPTGTILLRGARAITMKSDEIIDNADIVVKDNRIVSIGRRGAIPAGAKVMDVSGKTIMPGIVDVHAHWTEVRRGVLDLESWPLLANLAYGVTTGRDPQTSTNDIFAYQDLIEAGQIPGPRAFNTGPGVFVDSDFQSLDDARDVVSHYAKYYRTNTLKSYMVGNRQQRQWMVTAAKENKIMPTTEGGLDLKLDMTHAIDGFSGNEHSLPILPIFKDVVELFAKSRIRYTPTLLVAYGGPWAENFFYEEKDLYSDTKLRRFIPRPILYARSSRRPWFQEREHVYPRLAHEAAKIVNAGGSVTIGGHGQLQGIQCHWEMWALASGGLKNHEVLRAGTLRGAEAIGYGQDLGSLEPGKFADLLILDKNPLDNIRNTESIHWVMKNGELYEGETLDRIWPIEKKLPTMWWWNDRP